MNEFSILLKKSRTNSKRSQAWLARKLGVSNAAVNKWENGVSTPSFTHLRHLAELLGEDVTTWLIREDERRPTADPAELSETLSNCQNLKEIHQVMVNFAASLGLDNYAFFLVFRGDLGERPPALLLTNVSAEWQKIYSQKLYSRRDPSWEIALERVLPIFSDEILQMCRRRGDNEGVNFLLELATAGYPFVGMFPTHGPCCQSVTAFSVADRKKIRRLRDIQSQLMLAAHALHERVHALLEEERPHSKRPQLRPREQSLVLHMMRGSSLEVIASSMGISASAVRQRIQRLLIKFNVANRQELVLLAFALNLIPHDVRNYEYRNQPFTLHRLHTSAPKR